MIAVNCQLNVSLLSVLCSALLFFPSFFLYLVKAFFIRLQTDEDDYRRRRRAEEEHQNRLAAASPPTFSTMKSSLLRLLRRVCCITKPEVSEYEYPRQPHSSPAPYSSPPYSSPLIKWPGLSPIPEEASLRELFSAEEGEHCPGIPSVKNNVRNDR